MIVMMTPDKLRRIRYLTDKIKAEKDMPAKEVVELFTHISHLTAHVEYLQEVVTEVLDPEFNERSIQ